MAEEFGEMLRKYREKRGFTQWELYGELAEQVPRYTGVRSGSIISRWESAARKPPPYETILALEKILEVPDNLLLKAAGYASVKGREEGDLSTFVKEWDEFIDLVEQFNDSLSRISAKDRAVWYFEDAFRSPGDKFSTDKHPAELSAEPILGGLEVNLKIEKRDEVRFRRLLLRLKRRYPEFKQFEKWKGYLSGMIKECQETTYEVWRAAKDSTGMKMADSLILPGSSREGLYNIPKFIYDFAVDNHASDNSPNLQVLEDRDNLYKLVPKDVSEYTLAIGSREAMDRCEKTTTAFGIKYAQDARIAKIKEKERKMKDQAAIFQGVLSKVLADLAQ